MPFEHIIQINSFELSAPPLLTREQVWRGIALRVYDPVHFIMGLEGHAIRSHQRFDDGSEAIERTLYFGPFEVQDRAILTPMEQIRIEVAGTDRWPACSAITRIEEPEDGFLFLRFTYEWDEQNPSEKALSAEERGMREQAYQAMDMDAVSRIRELADTDMH